ncbi:MAG: hypothetical protein KME19_23925 [Microcoleus vaginatus WJT46-NPBG5]|jgi:hypothetical protein|nr:hypothetical protein [Microcoleus vaginatus WJT46-NPBG5]
MKLFKSFVIALVILANLIFAQPSFADKPKFVKNPEYIEITKALNSLNNAKNSQAQLETASPEETQKKIDELEFQKYALETGRTWGQCRNETGKTLAVYGPQPDLDDDDDYQKAYGATLYFLADGQTTKNKWDCEGVYLANDAQAVNLSADQQDQTLEVPAAIKITNGTQLVLKTNPDTAAVEFNLPTAKVVKADEVNWFIPNVSQALIDTRVPDAPTNKS